MRTRWLVVPSFVLALAACTAEPPAPPAGNPPIPALPDVVVLGTADGTAVVESGSGDVLAAHAGEVAAPDGSRLYATHRSDGSTIVRTRDAATGAVLSTTTLHRDLDVRVASITGQAVALMHPLPPGIDPSTPLPRSTSTIVVADPAGERASRTYRLHGNFEPEAFSVDDTRLFLIQYLPAEAPSVYRVTFLDLRRGKVFPVFGRFKTPPERMPGIRLKQVFDPVSQQLYTLYTNRVAEHYHGHWEGSGYGEYGDKMVSFVHVLNLRKGWAYCAGLPRKLWGQPAEVQAMATSPDGRSLFIVDSMRGLIAEMNTRSLDVVRTGHVDLGSLEGGKTSALMSTDGKTLYVGSARDSSGVYAIDVDTLRVRTRWDMAGAVTGLAMSADGARLYAALNDQVAIVDPASGNELGQLSFDGVDSILHVATPG